MSVCICIYIYINVYMYMYVHISICIYIHVYIYVCTCVHVYLCFKSTMPSKGKESPLFSNAERETPTLSSGGLLEFPGFQTFLIFTRRAFGHHFYDANTNWGLRLC